MPICQLAERPAERAARKLEPLTEQQEDELLVLESIFGDECSADRQQRAVTVRVEVRGRTLNLKAHLPKAYPALDAPLVLVEGSAASQISTDFAVRALRELFVPGASLRAR